MFPFSFNSRALAILLSISSASLAFTQDPPLEDPKSSSSQTSLSFTANSTVNTFSWSTIPSVVTVGAPLATTVTARDSTGEIVNTFDGKVNLRALSRPEPRTIGSGTRTDAFFINDFTSRLQAIYTPGEIGSTGRILSLALYFEDVPGVIENLTVRLKHTSKLHYSGTQNVYWETEGWTTVFSGNREVLQQGWHTISFTTPFEYDAKSPLMVDLSRDSQSVTPFGNLRVSNVSPERVLIGKDNSDHAEAPTTWSGTKPEPFSSTSLPHLQLSIQPILPTAPSMVTFQQGQWTGNLTVLVAGTELVLQSQESDRTEITALSNSFTATSIGSIDLICANEGNEGDLLQSTLKVTPPPRSALTVQLRSSDATLVSLPLSVTIPAGRSSITFPTNLLDDHVLDGAHDVNLQASATNHGAGLARIRVKDNETTQLRLLLPTSMSELSSMTGVVEMTSVANKDLTVTLTSSHPGRLSVPTQVIIPAGNNRADFSLNAVGNDMIEASPQEDHLITATLAGSPIASGNVQILDDEGRLFELLRGPLDVVEGSVNMTSPPLIRVQGILAAPLTIHLTSSDTEELSVPATLTLPAGLDPEVAIPLTGVDNTELDGARTVSITISGPGFTTQTHAVRIRDNDFHHFSIEFISAQVRNKPFNIICSARSIDNGYVSYSGSPVLTCTQNGLPLKVSPSTLSFSNQSTVYKQIIIDDLASNAVLTLTDPQITTHDSSVSSNAFAVGVGAATRFQWSTIESPRAPGQPIPVTLTALDAQGNKAASFTSSAAISLVDELTIGTGNSSTLQPLDTSYHDVRTQMIFTQNEMGPARTLTSLALNITSVNELPINAFTIRLRHTDKSEYSSITKTWENTGWTTCFQGNQTISQPGWRTFIFSIPFAYNGTSNLMVDISFNNSTSRYQFGHVLATSLSQSRSIYGYSNSFNGDPLEWTNSTPTTNLSYSRPNVRFEFLNNGTLSPSVTDNFSQGVWSGTIQISEPIQSLQIEAINAQIRGVSNSFSVSPSQLSLELPDEVSEGTSVLQGAVHIGARLSTPITISLSVDDPSMAELQSATVVVPAGELSTPFTLAIMKDALSSSTRACLITATATSMGSVSKSLAILDDALHDFIFSPISSPQAKNIPFEIVIKARNSQGKTITSYSGAHPIVAELETVPLPFTPLQANFENGIATLRVSISEFASQAVIKLSSPQGSFTSNGFSIQSGPATQIVWNSMPSSQFESTDFQASFIIQDAAGNPSTLNGPVSLEAHRERDVGTATTSSPLPFRTNQRICRSQQIIPSSEITEGVLTSVAFDVTQLSNAVTLKDFTIRVTNTYFKDYGTSYNNVWSDNLTTVYQGDLQITHPGKLFIPLTTAVSCSGDLLVDISYQDVIPLGGDVQVKATQRPSPHRHIHLATSTGPSPLTWVGSMPAFTEDPVTPDITLGFRANYNITPSTITLPNGSQSWSGTIRIDRPENNFRIFAKHSTGARGLSDRFNIHASRPTLHPEPPHTAGLSNTLHWTPIEGFEYELERSTSYYFESSVSTGFIVDSFSTQTGLIDGQTYYYRLRQRQIGGQGRPSSWSQYQSSIQDASPPRVNISQSDFITSTANAFVSGTFLDTSNEVTLSLDDPRPVAVISPYLGINGTEWKINFSDLALGSHSFLLTFTDILGHSTVKSIRIHRIIDASSTNPSPLVSPISQWVKLGQQANFFAAVNGARPMKFEWQRAGKIIPEISGPEWILSAAKTSDAAAYRLRIENNLGQITTDTFWLGIISPVPEQVTLRPGGTLQLKCTTTVPPGIKVLHRWHRAGIALSDGTSVSGAILKGTNAANLNITKMTPQEAGSYSCQVTLDVANAPVSNTENTLVDVVNSPPSILKVPLPDQIWVSQWIDGYVLASQGATSFSATGLPAGLKLDAATGRLTGRVTTPSRMNASTGLYIPSIISFRASNASGTGPAMTHELVINTVFNELSGQYHGLIPRNSRINSMMGGLAQLTVAKTGVATGTVTLAGQRYTFVQPIKINSEAGGEAQGGELDFVLPGAKSSRQGELRIIMSFSPGSIQTTIVDSLPLIKYEEAVHGELATPGSNDGSPESISAKFNAPHDIVFSPEGILYVADTENNTLRKMQSNPVSFETTTIAGKAGHAGAAPLFNHPQALTVDALGRLIIADTDNNTLRRYSPSEGHTILAGSPGQAGHLDGLAQQARFRAPSGVCSDSTGNLYVTDRESHVIRKITPTGAVSTLAGKSGVPGYADGSGASARFNTPRGITYDPVHQSLFVADMNNHVVRRISLNGSTTTYIGSPGVSGEAPGLGTNARLTYPIGITTDGQGTLYLTTKAVWQITASGYAHPLIPANPNNPEDTLSGIAYNSKSDQLFVAHPHSHVIVQHHFSSDYHDRLSTTFYLSIIEASGVGTTTPGVHASSFFTFHNNLESSTPFPEGHGHGTFQVSRSSTVNFAGRLADGQAITASAPLVESSTKVNLHVMLYQGTGVLMGSVRIFSDNHSGNFDWFKIPQALSKKDLSYPTGFDLTLNVQGEQKSTSSLHAYLGQSSSPASLSLSAINSATLGLEAFTPTLLTLTAANALRAPLTLAENPQGVKINYSPATGLFTGSFQVGTPTRTATFSGTFNSGYESGEKQGYGFFLLPESTLKGAPIHSGQVIISNP